MQPIPHSRPDISAADIAAVQRQLETGMVAEGDRAAELESRFARAVGLSHAVATGSGCQALLLALRAADVGPGDAVIMPNYVCGEVLGVVASLGARPAIVDVEEDYLLSIDATRRALDASTKAIVLPYTLGIYRDPRAFAELGPRLIEDCAQFIDPLPRRMPPPLGELVVYSLEGSKVMAAGEGGLVATDNDEIAAKLRTMKQVEGSPFKLNLFPMSDLHAALALAQLDRLPQLLARRRHLADRYFGALGDLAGIELPEPYRDRSMFFRFPVRLKPGGPRTIDTVIEAFRARGITVRRPVTPMLESMVAPSEPTPVAARLHAETISLPLFPALSDDDAAYIAEMTRVVLA